MQWRVALLAAVLVVSACGRRQVIVGSSSTGSGSSRQCEEITLEVDSSVDSSTLDWVKELLKLSLTNYSSSLCDISQATSRCVVTATSVESVVTESTTYRFDSSFASTAEADCDRRGGVWTRF